MHLNHEKLCPEVSLSLPPFLCLSEEGGGGADSWRQWTVQTTVCLSTGNASFWRFIRDFFFFSSNNVFTYADYHIGQLLSLFDVMSQSHLDCKWKLERLQFRNRVLLPSRISKQRGKCISVVYRDYAAKVTMAITGRVSSEIKAHRYCSPCEACCHHWLIH